jgi:hypothetical protein
MWEKLTFNLLKKFLDRIPRRDTLSSYEKTRLQHIVGEEVSQFLESTHLTDRSLRDLELNIESLLKQEGFLRDKLTTLSPSKLGKKYDTSFAAQDITKVNSE